MLYGNINLFSLVAEHLSLVGGGEGELRWYSATPNSVILPYSTPNQVVLFYDHLLNNLICTQFDVHVLNNMMYLL